jgi:uncharacterized membrane protein YkvA (DUF1232 family)
MVSLSEDEGLLYENYAFTVACIKGCYNLDRPAWLDMRGLLVSHCFAMGRYIREKLASLRSSTDTLLLAYLHPDLAWYKKAWILLVVAYAVSPIDLIPDFIPILGMLDDLLIIPLGVMVARKIVDPAIWQECQERREQGVRPPRSIRIIGVLIIGFAWAALAASLVATIKR